MQYSLPKKPRKSSFCDGAPLPLPPLCASVERSVFVGRERELAQLRQYWTQVSKGQNQLVLLTGEPGIGKTRLASEFTAFAHSKGATVLFGHADEGAALSYQPFIEALRHYVHACPIEALRAQLGPTGGELTSLAPELAQRLPDLPVPPSDDPDSQRYRLFDAFAALLGEASRAHRHGTWPRSCYCLPHCRQTDSYRPSSSGRYWPRAPANGRLWYCCGTRNARASLERSRC